MVGACPGIMDVFHAQCVCPIENPCVWPNCVPPRRGACVYDAVSFARNTGLINVLSSPCLCTANSGQTDVPSDCVVHPAFGNKAARGKAVDTGFPLNFKLDLAIEFSF